MQNWRLILDPKQDGAINMAIDEALLESVSSHLAPPTLRLYDWKPYTLSLGHAQSYSDVDQEALKSLGWGLVRRPTGGKAILHADELTYSVTASVDNPITSGNVIESYRRISLGLLKALEIIGIHSDSKPKDLSGNAISTSPVCFQFPSDYEITFDGKKLIGSAQARKKNGILQHGAVPLFGDITRIISVLNFHNDQEREIAKSQLLSRAVTVENIINGRINWDQMSDAMKIGFEETLEIKFFQDCLTKWEIERYQQIYSDKYSNSDWTLRI